MLSVEMLAAERGDAILVEYGNGTEATNRVLIDGGPVNSGLYEGVRNRLLAVPMEADGRRHFDLLVISHIDADHIEGVIRLLQDDELRCVFDDIWFNGWRHIEPLEPGATAASLGAAQGEFLGALLAFQGRPWNQYFGGGAVFVPEGDDAPPSQVLRGGMELTLLSPTIPKLKALARKWDKELQNMDFEPGEAAEALKQLQGKWWARPPVTLGDDDEAKASHDRSEANGSSIAFIASWQDHHILLAADAHDDVLTESLRRVRSANTPTDPVRLDALKLSHHGSQHNTTSQLMEEITADAYLVSTNGKRFNHPNALALATVISGHSGSQPPVFCFNYRQPETEVWENKAGLVTRYGEDARLLFD
ncbi:MAG: hypothetical protein AAGA65_26515 [Actinomycetota bacterium]